MKRYIMTAFVVLATHSVLFGGTALRTNPPSECSAPRRTCGCPVAGDEGEKLKTPCYFGLFCAGDGNDGDSVDNGCIMVWLGLGRTTPWTGSLGCSLKIFADDDSPSVFTPESLHAVLGGYTFKRLGQKTMADGVTPAEVVFSHPRGESVHFVFANGESLGRPDSGVHIKMDARLQMVDAEGWATTHDPVYYDLYVGDGTRRRFLATNATGALGALVSITDERGVTTTPADMGVDIIYDPDGVRQYLTPSRLANVTRTADFLGYDVAVYALQGPPQKDATTGLYIVPASSPVKHFSIRSGNGGKRASVTIRRGGGEPRTSMYDYAMGEWSLTRPSGVKEEKRRLVQDTKAAQIVREVKSASGERLSRRESNFKWMSWGFAMTNRVEGFDGVTDTTTWTYYTSGNGKGQVKTEKRQSGLLIQYAYDNLDRLVSETRSGPGMMTEVTTYSYTPVDAADQVLPVDTRPRTIVKTLNGIECMRTYYAYQPLTNIVERVGEQGAAYGGTNVLRTVTAYYPVEGERGTGNGEQIGADLRAVRSGFVASIRHEDGKIDHYDYSLVDGLWTGTTTHLHEQSPVPVNGKTTRDVSIANARGEVLETRTEAFVDDDWHVIARERRTYSAEGKPIRRGNLAGQVTAMAWDCCHKVSEVLPDGSTTTWDYDIEGRVIASSRLIPLDMTNVTWLTTCYSYDDLDRQTATWQTNYAAQVWLPVERTRYDQLGRVIARVDTLGNTTSTSYSSDGRTVSVQNPNTSTRVTTRSANGDTLSITGTAVTPEFHTYGVLADGARWSKTVQGETASSPRFTKRYENLLGQTIREEHSGFQGAVLVSTHAYDSYGRLVSIVADYEPTVEYTYDLLGNRIATTRQVGASLRGARDVEETEWRKTETLSLFVFDNSIVWLAQTNTVSCSDSSIAPLVTSSARQLTGLTVALPSRSRTTDVRGNVTQNETFVDSSFVTSRQTVPYATNKPLSLSRYGVYLMEVSVSAVTNTVAYDCLGRKISAIDGRGNVTHAEHNALGQHSATIDALGNRTTYAYDQFGYLVAVTNPLGHAVVYEYDLRGRKTYEGGATYPVRYTYDVFGNKVTMTTFRCEIGRTGSLPIHGDKTTWLFDEASGSMTNKVYADGKGTSYDYNSRGSLTNRTWARGIETTYTYNAWGDLARMVYSDDTPSVTLSYDAFGRQTNAVDAAGVTTFSYDIWGSLTNETAIGAAGTNTIERDWDNYGRSLGYALNGVRQSTLAYDLVTGRLSTMLANGSETPFIWNYLAGSDLKSSLAYPNGLTASWTYDVDNQLLQVSNAISTNIISQYGYVYDGAGRRINVSKAGTEFDQNDSIAYSYNERRELTNSVASVDSAYRYMYDFDDIGNRETVTEQGTNVLYSVNSLNQYTLVDDFEPQFDDDGNQTLVKTATGIWQVSYNGENRPVRWESGDTVVTMSYDRMGRRVTKNGQRFVYNGYLQIANFEIVTTNSQQTTHNSHRFIWDPTEPVATRPLSWCIFPGVGEVGYYIYDGNKNVSEVIAANSCVVAHYEYAPFGAVIVRHGSLASVNPWRFSSEYAEDDTGTVYYNYRHYEPTSARWLSRDPIMELMEWVDASSIERAKLEKEMINLSCYVNNDPIGLFDVNGLAAHVGVIAAIGCGVGAGFTLWTSIWGGETTCQCLCKATAACVIGAAAGALATRYPAMAGCFAGFGASLINNVSSRLCDWLCDVPNEQSWLCSFINTLITSAISCLAGRAFPLNQVDEAFVEALRQMFVHAIADSWGYDIDIICKAIK